MRVLALCGSLRAASVNAMLLHACVRLAPAGMSIEQCALAALPLFNPDLDGEARGRLPASVDALRAQVAGTDALLIASPEYAHGITGVMKNALDWLVSFPPVAGKLVAVLNASPRAHHADDALREILRTMSLNLVEAASIKLPLAGANLDEQAILGTPAIAGVIAAALAALRDAAQAAQVARATQEERLRGSGTSPDPRAFLL
jgi:NAD(P)H-dependent FMN reductase